VAVIGRVFVKSDGDLPVAYQLAKQIRLTPLKPGGINMSNRMYTYWRVLIGVLFVFVIINSFILNPSFKNGAQ